jgi:hypothetical protein
MLAVWADSSRIRSTTLLRCCACAGGQAGGGGGGPGGRVLRTKVADLPLRLSRRLAQPQVAATDDLTDETMGAGVSNIAGRPLALTQYDIEEVQEHCNHKCTCCEALRLLCAR